MKQIIAMGGGFLMDDTTLLDDFMLSRASGSASRVCFVATASGDSDRMLVHYYTALGPRCRATHLPLFRRQHADVAAHLLAQDVIYVGGGNTPNMLAVWRVHGVDVALSRAYEAGIMLGGVSAGALCWFESGVTDAFGGPLRRLDGGLGGHRLTGDHTVPDGADAVGLQQRPAAGEQGVELGVGARAEAGLDHGRVTADRRPAVAGGA
jgi:peptidase E